MRKKMLIGFVGLGALLATACGGSPVATSQQGATSQPVATTATPVVVVAQKEQPVAAVVATEVAPTHTSVQEARRFAVDIAKEATARMFVESTWTYGSESRATAENLWIEGEALEWDGELVLWFHVETTFPEGIFSRIFHWEEFSETGTWIAVLATYERRDEVAFDKVYITFSFEDNVYQSFYYYDRETIVAGEGQEFTGEPLWDQRWDTWKDGPPPWIVGAK